jgi:hypothetical protein
MRCVPHAPPLLLATAIQGSRGVQVAADIIRQDGIRGLFGRGLGTKIGMNGVQSAVFTIAWKLGQNALGAPPPPPRAPPAPAAACTRDVEQGTRGGAAGASLAIVPTTNGSLQSASCGCCMLSLVRASLGKQCGDIDTRACSTLALLSGSHCHLSSSSCWCCIQSHYRHVLDSCLTPVSLRAVAGMHPLSASLLVGCKECWVYTCVE